MIVQYLCIRRFLPNLVELYLGTRYSNLNVEDTVSPDDNRRLHHDTEKL
jgi:hypothetical protein